MLNPDEIKMATVLIKCEVYVLTFDGRTEKCTDTEVSQTMSMTPIEVDHPRLRCNLHKRLDTVIDAMIAESKKAAEAKMKEMKRIEARLAAAKV